MVAEAIESLVFTQKSKAELIDETILSLQGVLYDAFSKKDVQNLKHEFPTNTSPDDLRIKLDNVIIYIESLNNSGLSVEVILDIILNQNNSELGTYSHIFNENGDLIDEFLVIN